MVLLQYISKLSQTLYSTLCLDVYHTLSVYENIYSRLNTALLLSVHWRYWSYLCLFNNQQSLHEFLSNSSSMNSTRT